LFDEFAVYFLEIANLATLYMLLDYFCSQSSVFAEQASEWLYFSYNLKSLLQKPA